MELKLVFDEDFLKKNKREFKGNSIIDYPKSYVAIDIETTGLSSIYDEIIELGAIRL